MITVVYSPGCSFEVQDAQSLSNHFLEIQYVEKPRSKSEWPRFLNELRQAVKESDLVFTWFAGYHAYAALKLCQLHKTKLMVVAGGYDVACEPEIDYGAFNGWKDAHIAREVLSKADMVLCVSNFNEGELLKRVVPKAHKMIYSAVDTNKYKPGKERHDLAMTICSTNENAMRRKGLEHFWNAAPMCPRMEFVRTGHMWVDEPTLIRHYQNALIYIQPSFYESFGLSVAEAMSCGCIPIVSDRGALREVIGDTGLSVPYGSPTMIANAVNKIRDSNFKEELEFRARNRIIEMFSLRRRETRLYEAIEEMLA